MHGFISRKVVVAVLSAVTAISGFGAVSLAVAGAANAATTVSASTALHARPDSGYSGDNWANDSMTRTAAVTLVEADATLTDCGATATSCYSYTGTISDTGTAYAVTGAISPGAQAIPITGSPQAAISGTASVTFDASSNTPDAADMPAKWTGGGGVSTTDWVEQFFGSDVTFGAGPDLTTWAWHYSDAADCQQWTDAYNGSQATSGDITGVSQCAPAPVTNKLSAVDVCGNYANRHWTVTDTAGDRNVTFYASTRLNSGKYLGIGHSLTVGANGSVSFVTHRGGSFPKGLRLGYSNGTTGKWLYSYFASGVKACV
jgi:hypothetical protein